MIIHYSTHFTPLTRDRTNERSIVYSTRRDKTPTDTNDLSNNQRTHEFELVHAQLNSIQAQHTTHNTSPTSRTTTSKTRNVLTTTNPLHPPPTPPRIPLHRRLRNHPPRHANPTIHIHIHLPRPPLHNPLRNGRTRETSETRWV